MNICCDRGLSLYGKQDVLGTYSNPDPYGVMNNEGSTKIVEFMSPGMEGFLLHRGNITHLVKISSRTQTKQTEYAVISKDFT